MSQLGDWASPHDPTGTDRKMTGVARNQSISSHPAFRWAVGAWFAALLGGGLFVMPDAVHAGLRQMIGVEGILPAGLPGKAALSGAAALIGLLLGLLVAMRVASLNALRDDDREAGDDSVWLGDEPAFEDAEPVDVELEEPRRPFNPRDYFGDPDGRGWSGDDSPADTAEVAHFESEGDDFKIEDYLPEAELGSEEPAESEPVVDAIEDSEWMPEEIEPAALDEPERVTGPSPHEPTAFGDLSLAELTARLGRAIEARRTAEVEGAADKAAEADPVIAFLRREADRAGSERDGTSGEDPQAALRGALDRLSQVSNPR